MVIFWGSESGTAERFALRLANELEQRFGLRILVADLDAFDHRYLVNFSHDKVAGFILSTYGEGDPPGNTDAFWRTLTGFVEQKTKLDSLRYFLFGLGNRNYRHYNRVAEVVDGSLQKLGARRIGPAGRADDSNGGTEEEFLSWKQEIVEHLRRALNLEERPQSYRPSINVSEGRSDDDDSLLFLGEPHPSLLRQSSALPRHPDPNAPFVLPVTEARELFSSSERTCLHMEFSLEHVPWIKYQTGDHLAIWPMNPDEEVERLLNLLGLKDKAHSTISITAAEGSSSTGGRVSSTLPPSTTIDALFRYYLEICAPLSRDILAGLAEFAPGKSEQEYLHLLATDRQVFETEVLASHQTLAALLSTISGDKTWNIPLPFLVERLRKMQPRRYSISSSAVTHPRRPSITVVVDTKHLHDESDNNCSRRCYGLTTNYLLALQQSVDNSSSNSPDNPSSSRKAPQSLAYTLTGPRNLLSGTKVFGQIRRSTFKPPPKESTPIILIGAGTGIAPLRGFVQERARVKEIGKVVGKTVLILGFRKRDEDFLYAEEWDRYQKVLGEDRLQIWTAFSREDHDHPEGQKNKKSVYVQDRLREHAEEVLQLLEQEDRSAVYICGSARMARDVLAELKRCWASSREHQRDGDADAWLDSLKRDARLHEDVWG